ncbi:hypothetical protein [Leifsonia sp. Leaf264]|uniref:hypothetical protein n=1 Tax=Leifsonia sp. Leaf264 TaxID=1736314 RepID=UPI0007017631|nr:hypothetical protein [Leifsonia sp. Leaf264]KQO98429.1 hypothetical protein ASF30_10230 [Leifsonia sp. Leaf264]
MPTSDQAVELALDPASGIDPFDSQVSTAPTRDELAEFLFDLNRPGWVGDWVHLEGTKIRGRFNEQAEAILAFIAKGDSK